MVASPLSVKTLRKEYGETVAVDRVSFAVEPGSVVALLGPNGAGKTTVMHCIMGTRQPTSGSIEVFGASVGRLEDASRQVGFAGEMVGCERSSSVVRQLRDLAHATDLPGARVEEVIEDCGLQHVAARPAGKLSTGERMRLSLALALVGEPELLVLDEPTNGLDADGIRWIRTLLRQHSDQGGSVLLTSHLLSEVEQLADDVTVLDHSVRYQGPLAGLLGSDESLEDAYFSLLSAPPPNRGDEL
jgi:ABC-2 type transport system ATP-binding protein